MNLNLLWLWGGCGLWATCFVLYDRAGRYRTAVVWVGHVALAAGLFLFLRGARP